MDNIPINLLKKNKFFKALTSAVTIIAFITTTLGADLVYAAQTPSNYPQVITIGNNKDIDQKYPLDGFDLPGTLGKVISVSNGSRDKVIIHIQDAHCNYDAQKKISEIIGYLNENYGTHIINLEGGEGEYDLSAFRGIRNKPVREKISEDLLEEGIINGAEYFAVNSGKEIFLWGVEDTGLYADNLSLYRDMLGHKERAESYLSSMEGSLEILKVRLFSKDLIEFEAMENSYKSGRIDIKEYVTYIIDLADKNRRELSSFTNIKYLSESIREEKYIDFKEAQKQREVLIQKMNENLSVFELEELLAETVRFKENPQESGIFYDYLINKMRTMNVEKGSFSELEKYIKYIKRYEDIDKDALMEELGDLGVFLKEGMYETSDQKEIDMISRHVDTVRDLLNAALTRRDYDKYKKYSTGFSFSEKTDFLKEKALELGEKISINSTAADVEISCKKMADFYEHSFLRDEVLMQRIKFDSGRNSGTRKYINDDIRKAVLLTGGFHSDNIRDLAVREGISYISIMPAFENKDGYESPYFDLLSGRPSGLLKYVNSAISMMAIYSYLCGNYSERIHGMDISELVDGLGRLYSGADEYVTLLDGQLDIVVQEDRPEVEGYTSEEVSGYRINGKKVWIVWDHPGVEDKILEKDKTPPGGSWSSNPFYIRWIAPFAEPLVSFLLSDLITGGGTVMSALAAGSIFWGIHVFRAIKESRQTGEPFFSKENIMFDKNIVMLAGGIFIAGVPLFILGLWHPFTILSLAALGIFHFISNFKAAGQKEKPYAEKKKEVSSQENIFDNIMKYIIVGVFAIGLNITLSFIMAYIESLLPVDGSTLIEGIPGSASGAGSELFVIGSSLITPIAEEVLFRGAILSAGFIFVGWILKELMKKDKSSNYTILTGAVLFQASIFSASHFLFTYTFTWMQFLNIVTSGVILGFLAVRHGTFLPGVIAHIGTNNFVNTQVIYSFSAEYISLFFSFIILYSLLNRGKFASIINSRLIIPDKEDIRNRKYLLRETKIFIPIAVLFLLHLGGVKLHPALLLSIPVYFIAGYIFLMRKAGKNDINDPFTKPLDEKVGKGGNKKPYGGSWSSDPFYTRWIAPFAEPLLSFFIADIITGGGTVMSALAAGGIFWILHVFRAIKESRETGQPFFSKNNIMFDRYVVLLSFLTFISGIPFFVSELWYPGTLLSLGALFVFHYNYNKKALEKRMPPTGKIPHRGKAGSEYLRTADGIASWDVPGMLRGLSVRREALQSAGEEKRSSRKEQYETIVDIAERIAGTEYYLSGREVSVLMDTVSGHPEYFSREDTVDPFRKLFTKEDLIQIIRDIFNPFYGRKGFFALDLFSGEEPSVLPVDILNSLGFKNTSDDEDLFVFGVDSTVKERMKTGRRGVIKSAVHDLVIPDNTCDVITMFNPDTTVYKKRAGAVPRPTQGYGRKKVIFDTFSVYRKVKAVKNDDDVLELIGIPNGRSGFSGDNKRLAVDSLSKPVEEFVRDSYRMLKPGGSVYIAPHQYQTFQYDYIYFAAALLRQGFSHIELMPFSEGLYSGRFRDPEWLIIARKPVSGSGASPSLIGKLTDNDGKVVGGVISASQTGRNVLEIIADNMEPVKVGIASGLRGDVPSPDELYRKLKVFVDENRHNIPESIRNDMFLTIEGLIEKLNLEEVKEIIPLKEHKNIQGVFGRDFRGENVLFLNYRLIENPMALLHELGEGYVEIPEGFEGMTRHTFMRGAGKDVREAYAGVVLDQEFGTDTAQGIEDYTESRPFIDALERELERMAPRQDLSRTRSAVSGRKTYLTESEKSLIRWNFSNGITGEKALYGVQDHLSVVYNYALTKNIKGSVTRLDLEERKKTGEYYDFISWGSLEAELRKVLAMTDVPLTLEEDLFLTKKWIEKAVYSGLIENDLYRIYGIPKSDISATQIDPIRFDAAINLGANKRVFRLTVPTKAGEKMITLNVSRGHERYHLQPEGDMGKVYTVREDHEKKKDLYSWLEDPEKHRVPKPGTLYEFGEKSRAGVITTEEWINAEIYDIVVYRYMGRDRELTDEEMFPLRKEIVATYFSIFKSILDNERKKLFFPVDFQGGNVLMRKIDGRRKGCLVDLSDAVYANGAGEFGRQVFYSEILRKFYDARSIFGSSDQIPDILIEGIIEGMGREPGSEFLRVSVEGQAGSVLPSNLRRAIRSFLEDNSAERSFIGKLTDNDGNVVEEIISARQLWNNTLEIVADNMGAVEVGIASSFEGDIPSPDELYQKLKIFISENEHNIPPNIREDMLSKINGLIEKLNLKRTKRIIPLKDHKNIKGVFGRDFRGENVLFLNYRLIESPMALLHELGERYIEIPEGFEALTRHTLMRGAGKDVREAYFLLREIWSEKEINEMDLDTFLGALAIQLERLSSEGKLSRERIHLEEMSFPGHYITPSEKALIRWNFEKNGVRGKYLLFGLQDHLDNGGNIRFSHEIRTIAQDLRKNTLNLFLIPEGGKDEGFKGKLFSMGKALSRKIRKKFRLNTEIYSFSHNDTFDEEDFNENMEKIFKEAVDNLDMDPMVFVVAPTESHVKAARAFIERKGEEYSDINVGNMFGIANDPISPGQMVDEARVVVIGSALMDDRRLRNILKDDVRDAYLTGRRVRMLSFLKSNSVLEAGFDPDDAESMDALLERIWGGREPLDITKVNWETIRDWKEAQDRVAVSL